VDEGAAIDRQRNAGNEIRLIGRQKQRGVCDVPNAIRRNDWARSSECADIIDGRLYGRGNSDMKAGMAAFFEAVRKFRETRINGGITLVIT
jgi:Peptidase family M20/M25/M40